MAEKEHGVFGSPTFFVREGSTKNQSGKRDPEMYQPRKGNQWFFGMKAHIGADVDSGLGRSVTTTPAHHSEVGVVRPPLE